MKRLALLAALALLACGDTATEPAVDQQFTPVMSLLGANEDSQGQVLTSLDVGAWPLWVYDTTYDPAAVVICTVSDADDSWPDWRRMDAEDHERMTHIRVHGSLSLDWIQGRPEGAPEGGDMIGTGHATFNAKLKSDGTIASITEMIVGRTATQEIKCKRVSDKDGTQYGFEWGPLEE